MKKEQVIHNGISFPLTSPAFPPAPYRFVNREYFIITYETDLEALRRVVPEPLEIDESNPYVKYEFIRMPDSSGLGDYTESGIVIPVRYKGEQGGYVHSMFLDLSAPISCGREIWGFPKKLGFPTLEVDGDTLLGELKYGKTTIARATMGYKFEHIDPKTIEKSMAGANFLVKKIPHVDGTPRICELVKYYLTDITVKGAWTGPVSLEYFQHALAPVAELPIKKIVSAVHFVSDLTLPYGEVAYDYLQGEK